MRTAMLMLAAALTPWIALAQGQFVFGNKNLLSNPVIDAEVVLPDGTPTGAGYGRRLT